MAEHRRIPRAVSQLIISRIVQCTAVVERVHLMVGRGRRTRDAEGPTLVVYIVSDSGTADTVVNVLIRRAHDTILRALQIDHPSMSVEWRLLNRQEVPPDSAEPIYIRPATTVLA